MSVASTVSALMDEIEQLRERCAFLERDRDGWKSIARTVGGALRDLGAAVVGDRDVTPSNIQERG